MPVLELEEFKKIKSDNKSIICLDLGQRRIGISLSDKGWNIAGPYGKIEHKKFTLTAEEIFKIYDDNHCCGLVIGLPVNIDGSEGEKCQSSRQFGRNILKLRDIPIYFQDERFTTIQAEEVLGHSELSRSKKNQKIDKIAASFILQALLDRC